MSAMVRRSASLRVSRPKAKTARTDSETRNKVEDFGENSIPNMTSENSRPKLVPSMAASSSNAPSSNYSAPSLALPSKFVLDPIPPPLARLPLSPTKSANGRLPLSPSKLANGRLPLSPSKSANGSLARLPLSPTKRHNSHLPLNAVCSPSKLLRADENSPTGERKALLKPGRSFVLPQSPLTKIQSPKMKTLSSPPSKPLTPRNLFETGKKPEMAPTMSKPLRTPCHPPSPLKMAAFGFQNVASSHVSPMKSSASPLTPADVRRNMSFNNSEAAASAILMSSQPSSATSTASSEKDVISPTTSSDRGSAAPSSTASLSPCKASSVTPTKPPSTPTESRLARLNLHAAASPYASARKAFHTATPSVIKGRDAERKEIVDFIEGHLQSATSGALYVSGAPGTGKTATLNAIIAEYKSSAKFTMVYLNCMSVRNSSLIFGKIHAEVVTAQPAPKGGVKGAQKAVEKLLTAKGKPILLFLDEMDQLGDANNQDVLYTLFEWTFVPRSRLILVGVANALDLTDRILPRLQAKAKRKPKTLNFAPYSQSQLIEILTERLSASSSPASASASASASPLPESLVDKSALIFCAKKVAAVSGDVRKALDACRYAVEMVEKSSASSTPNATPNATPTASPAAGPKKVGITHVMRVLANVYENSAVASPAAAAAAAAATGAAASGGGTLTLHQKIIICCLVLLHKKAKTSKGVTVGRLQEVFRKVCQRKGFVAGMSASGGGDQAEFLSILSNIEAAGILTIKKEKISRDSKVNFLLDDKELEKSLQDDRKMLAAILQSDILG